MRGLGTVHSDSGAGIRVGDQKWSMLERGEGMAGLEYRNKETKQHPTRELQHEAGV